jgi:antirestriction protein ArdC
VHATRHPSRLNRDFGQKRFGDHGYALEEVTAEMGAAFIGAQIGLPADHIEDHASYIASWLEVLTSNPNAFLTAAAKAQAAADWVLEKMGVSRADVTEHLPEAVAFTSP